MSLFQSKVWWTTKIAANQEFDAGHLAVGRFGSRDENNRILVASFDGVIRVYDPREGGFKPNHLILEKDEGKPVLQVCVLRFEEAGDDEMVAVLFSKGFVVYGFHTGQEGLLLKNEARDEAIDRLCYNMCACYIGGEGLLCIQSQEGMLFFYSKSNRICRPDSPRHFPAPRRGRSEPFDLRPKPEPDLHPELGPAAPGIPLQ